MIQECPAGWDKNGTVSGPKRVLRLGRNCPAINNTTIEETIRETIAPPSPLPAGGPAPAVLDAGKQVVQSVNRPVACGKLRPPSY